MGNTKYIAFAGDIYPGEEEFFTEHALLVEAHGDHVGVKTLHCYLHWEGEGEDTTAEPYVIGHLTSHSMSGFRVVNHIASHMKSGHIQQTDVDWADMFWLIVEDRKITQRIELIEKPKPANASPAPEPSGCRSPEREYICGYLFGPLGTLGHSVDGTEAESNPEGTE